MKTRPQLWYLGSVFCITFLLEMYWNGAISYYYMNQLGLELNYQMATWTIFSVFMIFSCAFCGKNSDRALRFTSRRLPYIRFFGVAAGVIFALTYVPWFPVGSQFLLSLRFLCSLLLLDISCQFAYTALFAIPSEEIVDIPKRSLVYSRATFLQFVACMLIAVGIPIVQPGRGEESTVYAVVMMAIGLVVAVVLYIGSKKIPSTYVSNREQIKKTSYLKSFLQCIRNKKFMIGEIFLTATVVASGFLTFGFFYFVDEVSTEQDPRLALLIGSCIVGALLLFGFCPKLLERFPIQNVVSATGLLCGGCLILCYMGWVQPWFAIFGGLGCGISFGIQYYFNQIMVADFVDEDEVYSGIRKEGEYFGLDSVFDCVGALSQPLFLLILIANGFQEGLAVGTQSAGAEHGILIGFLLVPGVLVAVSSVILFLFYPKIKTRKGRGEPSIHL